jgi:HTH-type transcriptional regulator/antitoxin HigA
MNAEEYEIAVRELSALFDAPPEPNTPEGTRFEVLISPVYQYDKRIPPLD